MIRPRCGRRVSFRPGDGGAGSIEPATSVTGLRFTIRPQVGSDILIDYTQLKPRRLALAVAKALRELSASGGPLTVRSTVKAYVVTLPRFFAYLEATGARVGGIEDLRAAHIDGFEAWLEAEGLSRIHLFTVIVKVVAVLRQIAADAPGVASSDLRDRLRYVSAKPFQRPRPRDALSPYVARQLRDAARTDVIAITRRIQDGPPVELDPALQKANAAAHAIIAERGVLTQNDRAWMLIYHARWRRGIVSPQLSERLHGFHHLTAADVIPFLVLLSLDTGLEIECCKTLTVDCLRNASGGTVEIVYLKRRARGAEHKTLRVRDAGLTTPGGLIRKLIELTAAARHHHPSQSLWIYYRAGALTDGIRQPRETIDAWTARHGIIDNKGRPLRLLLSLLRKTHKALWYLKTEGHVARFAVGHTPEIAARHYADLPALRPLHEATVAEALEEAVASALKPIVLTPEQEDVWRADPRSAPNVPSESDPIALLDGKQDVWLASCGGFYASPHGKVGSPCPIPFWGCLECSNAVITARKLPAILSFLHFIEDQRRALAADDWTVKFGRAYVRITTHVLPAFSPAVIAEARRTLITTEPAAIYLPPEARL